MNPYLLLGAGALYVATALGTWFYRGHIDDEACAGRVNAVNLQWQEQETKRAQLEAKAATAVAGVADTTTEQHHEDVQQISAAGAAVQQQVKVIVQKAKPADCLRQPVDPGLDGLLRQPAAAAGDPAGTGGSSGGAAGASSGAGVAGG